MRLSPLVEEALTELIGRPAWHKDALCRQHPEVDFFPSCGARTREAKAVCAACPVSEECRGAGNETYCGLRLSGIWGGTTMTERRPALPTADARHGTVTGYQNHGCRCERCKAAHATYQSERRPARARRR